MKNKRTLNTKFLNVYDFRLITGTVLFIIYSSTFSFSKSSSLVNAKADSLQKVILHSDDTYTKAKALVGLSEIIYLTDIDSVIPLCINAITIIDNVLKDTTNLTRRQVLNTKASALNNIGYVFYNKGNISKALNYYMQAMKLREETGDKLGLAESYDNLGALYKNQGDKNQAIGYYQKSLKIYEELNNSEGQAILFGNMGVIYASENDYDKALDYYFKGLKLQESLGNKQGLARLYINIGLTYSKNCGTDEALKYYRKGLELSAEIGDKADMANVLFNISLIEFNNNNLKEAKDNGTKALELAKELGFPGTIKDVAGLMYNINRSESNWKEALDMQLLYTAARDSVNNEEWEKMIIQKEFQYEYDKKEAVLLSGQEKEREIADEKRKSQQLNFLLLLSVLIATLIITLIIYRSLRQSKIARKLIEEQKEIADHQRKIAEEQKLIIEIKNKEIIDSIYYARRIQRVFLTSDNYIKNLIREYFILYNPKDIVSGDFYWVTNKNNCIYVVTSDCTGHGVPGAFMSMIGINLLNEIINEREITDPALALDLMRKDIIKNLNPEGSTEEAKEGMDIVLCKFDFQNNLLEFAAANNALYLVRNGTLTEYKADKMPVGKFIENAKTFTKQTIELQKDDIIYTFTDGYPDQFGGTKGKKYLYKKLEKKLLSISHLPTSNQKDELLKEFEEWKGGLEQVDDVTVIGIKI